MRFNDTVKQIKRALARYGLFVTSSFIGYLPYGLVKIFMRVMTAIAFQFTIRLRRTARETIMLAFEGQKSEKEVDAIIGPCFRNLGMAMIELIYFSEHPSRVKDYVRFEGRNYLDEALSKRNGVVAVTAHFGNFALMQLAMAQFGYKTSVIIRRARDKAIADHVFKTMTKTGVTPIYSIPARECVKASLQALKRNEIVFVLLDQNFGSQSGIFVDFFGRKAATGIGPVIFAERAQAPILPIFNVREFGEYHKIIVEPPYYLQKQDDRDAMIHANISYLTRIIESYIRKYPHEWGWMHRRWKTQEPAARGEYQGVNDANI